MRPSGYSTCIAARHEIPSTFTLQAAFPGCVYERFPTFQKEIKLSDNGISQLHLRDGDGQEVELTLERQSNDLRDEWFYWFSAEVSGAGDGRSALPSEKDKAGPFPSNRAAQESAMERLEDQEKA